MAEPSPITITPSEPFEHLPCAPIVEAVIQLRARSETPQTSNNLKAVFKEKLPEYSTVKSVCSVSVTLAIEAAGKESSAAPAEPPLPERAWHGLRLETEDSRNVAMFTREYFSRGDVNAGERHLGQTDSHVLPQQIGHRATDHSRRQGRGAAPPGGPQSRHHNQHDQKHASQPVQQWTWQESSPGGDCPLDDSPL